MTELQQLVNEAETKGLKVEFIFLDCVNFCVTPKSYHKFNVRSFSDTKEKRLITIVLQDEEIKRLMVLSGEWLI